MTTKALSASRCWWVSRLSLVLTLLLGESAQAATPHLEAGAQAVRESQMDVAAQQQLQNNQLNQSTTDPQSFLLQMQRTDKTPIKNHSMTCNLRSMGLILMVMMCLRMRRCKSTLPLISIDPFRCQSSTKSLKQSKINTSRPAIF